MLATGVFRNRPQAEAPAAASATLQETSTAETSSALPLVSGPVAPPEDAGASASEEGAITVAPAIERNAQTMLSHMTLEEKVAQLFFVTPEAITGYNQVTRCGDVMRDALTRYPVGGLILLAQNLEDPEQTRDMLSGMQEHATDTQGVPILLGLDEEGGRVLRVAANPAFHVPNTPSMAELSALGEDAVYNAANAIGAYLKDLGFNLDFAPVADVFSNPQNDVIGDRSFGSDPQMVAQMAWRYAEALSRNDILAVYKHFPGHGDTLEDSHEGYAYSYKSAEELHETELVPFVDGIDRGIDIIMIAHITLPQVTEEAVPATLSKEIVTTLLREELGFDGIVITDALDMGAISDHYTAGEASVLALQAGCDMLLMADNFAIAYDAVLAAVQDGRLTEERIDESVLRILNLKLEMD